MSYTYWIDGNFQEKENVSLSPLTHTFHYGLGVFEGVRSYKSVSGNVNIFRLKEHTDRLFESAKIVGICLLYTSPSPRDRQKSRMPSSA